MPIKLNIKNIASTSLKIAVLTVAACCLNSCSTTKSADNAAIGTSNESGAHAKGIGDQMSFGNKDKNRSGLTAADRANRLKPSYDQVYYFGFDQYDVQQDDVPSIEVQANYLTAHSNARVRLEGHADERGSREYNIALGWKRAKAIAAILERQGVASSQIAMVSYGKEKPVATGHDEEAYSLNRRANFIYEAK